MASKKERGRKWEHRVREGEKNGDILKFLWLETQIKQICFKEDAGLNSDLLSTEVALESSQGLFPPKWLGNPMLCGFCSVLVHVSPPGDSTQ